MPQPEKSAVLYHYTDFQALDGILLNAELRVNNILNMNDASEMRLFMRGLAKAVCARLEGEGSGDLAQATRKLFDQELKKEFAYSAYAACFSRYRDDAAQWERYGNRGKGVCIAFYGDRLQRLAVGALSLQTVFYQDDMTEHPLVEVFYRLARTVSPLEGNQSQVQDALHAAWVCSAAFKHPSFACENEVRLVVSPFEQEYFNVQPGYHISPDRIKKYYPLRLDRMCQRAGLTLEDLVAEIIIGPESTQSLPILQDYLRDHGLRRLAEKLSLSACPLRRSFP
ncbi:MAG: DUF2971 domain-containing protein [Clostridiales bacterium]|nr:DUF2971 domain-containing protein [Clostridiales bacterium]